MAVLSAQTIERLKVIQPCLRPSPDSQGNTRGLSACGYDLRLTEGVRVTSLPRAVVHLFVSAVFLGVTKYDASREMSFLVGLDITCALVFAILGLYGMANAFKLAGASEYFNLPANVVGRVHDKSSLARRGLAVQNTVAEPGWHGHLTLELSNHGWKSIKLEAGDAVAQVLFEFLDEPTDRPYDGKYQGQERGPVAHRRKDT